MSEAQPSPDDVREERDRQSAERRHMNQLQFNNQGQLTRGTIRELTDASDLDDAIVRSIQNYISKTWVLSNFTSAQEHDMWWRLEVRRMMVMASFPPEDSLITGKTRAFLMDDPAENKEPLSSDQRNKIRSFFDSLQAQVTRNREGFEREMLQSQIRESRTDDDLTRGGGGSSDSGGIFGGLF